jgi:hypothetical protein
MLIATTIMPATFDNVLAQGEFPHRSRGTDSVHDRFGNDHMELSMIAHRKTAHSRKAATRKTVRKTTARKAGSARRKTSGKKTSGKTSARKTTSKRWSQRVTRESDALDLKRGVFTLTDPKKIAASLKRSAERSSRRKTGAYRSALSMLTFYINRAGNTLPKTQRDRLQRAKTELKQQFGRDE